MVEATQAAPVAAVQAGADVSFDEYMARYAADFYELAGGALIKMSPVSSTHDRILRYLALLFEAYLELTQSGEIRIAPFVMKLPGVNKGREPDLQVILKTNPGELTETYQNGPADLCIEVVSPESVTRDHGDKFQEYERGGVPEYWIVDPLHNECRFYRLSENAIEIVENEPPVKMYVRAEQDAQGLYRTVALPGLALHVPTLWQPALPGPAAVVEAVRAMVNTSKQ